MFSSSCFRIIQSFSLAVGIIALVGATGCRHDEGESKATTPTPSPRPTISLLTEPPVRIELGATDRLSSFCERYSKALGAMEMPKVSYKYPISHDPKETTLQLDDIECLVDGKSAVLYVRKAGEGSFKYGLSGFINSGETNGAANAELTKLSTCTVGMFEPLLNFYVGKLGWADTSQLRGQIVMDLETDVCPAFEKGIKETILKAIANAVQG